MFTPRGYNRLDDPSELEGSELSTIRPPAAYQAPPRGNAQYGMQRQPPGAGYGPTSAYQQRQPSMDRNPSRGNGLSDAELYNFADYQDYVPGGFVPPPLPKPSPTELLARNFYTTNRASDPHARGSDPYTTYTNANPDARDPTRNPFQFGATDLKSPPPPTPPVKDAKTFVTSIAYKEEAELSPSRSIDRIPNTPLPTWKKWLRSKWGRRFTSTWVCWTLSFIQLIVFFCELGHYGSLVGKPIETKPSFNWMIGPSVYSLINYGARYQPCMRAIPDVQNSTELISWPCPNSTTTDFTCALTTLCGPIGAKVPTPQPGVGTYDQPPPNQWLRFIIPIFLHVGLIHIAFNLLLQLTVGRAMELALGHGPFLVIYLLCGIFGFILGANFAGTNQASMGASGAIFGMLAINILVILYSDKIKWKDLGFIFLDVIISLILGLIPGVDNFAHIGGLLMGFCSGVILLRTPDFCDGRRGNMPATLHSFRSGGGSGSGAAASSGTAPPVAGFREMLRGISSWRERTWRWWIWVGARVMAFIIALLAFILLLKNFYVWHGTCSWCKHLSCLPWGDYCKRGDLSFITQTTTTTTPNNGGGSSSTNSKRAVQNIARGLVMSFTG